MSPCSPALKKLLLLLLCGAAPLLQAQTEAIVACQSIAEREARFACYDRAEAQHAAAVALPRSPPAPAGDAPQSAVATSAASGRPTVEDFGKQSARVEQDEAGQPALLDRVAELKEVQHKQWQITLESGQVWRQQLSQTYNLRAGHEVRITPINEGPNHRLSSPQLAGSIQVRRVR